MRVLAVVIALSLFPVAVCAKHRDNHARVVEQNKDAYVDLVEKKLEAWEGLIKKVRSGDYSDPAFKKGTTPKQARRMTDDLEKTKELVEKDLDKLKDAADSDWTSWRSKIEKRLTSMRHKFGRVLAE